MNSFRNNGNSTQDHDDHEQLLAAQAHIWNHIFNFINSMSLKCALELGIPNIIHKHGDNQPMTLHQLVNSLPVNQEKSQFIPRLMRILTHSGFFRKEKTFGEEGYSLTPSSKLLVKDNPSSVTPFVMAMLDPLLMDPWHHLSQWFQYGSDVSVTPFTTCHGKGLWELAGDEPGLNRFFNEAMTSDCRLVSKVVIKNCGDVFLGMNSMVDVGGGTGTMAKALADAFPNLKCTVLDLPHVVDGLKNSCTEDLVFVGGDMFDAIPPADAVLLKWILHDWSDEECVQILKKCKEAIPNKKNGGKVIIIDMVIKKEEKHKGNKNGTDHEGFETQLFFDMLMMVLVTGKERNEEEWANLFHEAGFNSYTITPLLGLRSLIENDMIKPAIQGVANILRTCAKSGTAKRVVFTSSAAAVTINETSVVQGLSGMKETELMWCFFCLQKPNRGYPVSKTLAEKAAWKFAEENNLDLITVIPSLIAGLSLTPDIPSSVNFAMSLVTENEFLINGLKGMRQMLSGSHVPYSTGSCM
ncbi:OLC1v1023847C1 [Oldenlandia corymbosa var. corymbosa]|uniref:7'-O-demethylcephaeline methyltransferase n=1 Tax=Oldenlandia corymbosa var. corymbosa TaxID=529605 RepID=A0AAV1C3B9_OLDCO|nr:OLC1v1023847C1 [Oldenlandia corymbosa var. corymbosa]